MRVATGTQLCGLVATPLTTPSCPQRVKLTRKGASCGASIPPQPPHFVRHRSQLASGPPSLHSCGGDHPQAALNAHPANLLPRVFPPDPPLPAAAVGARGTPLRRLVLLARFSWPRLSSLHSTPHSRIALRSTSPTPNACQGLGIHTAKRDYPGTQLGGFLTYSLTQHVFTERPPDPGLNPASPPGRSPSPTCSVGSPVGVGGTSPEPVGASTHSLPVGPSKGPHHAPVHVPGAHTT